MLSNQLREPTPDICSHVLTERRVEPSHIPVPLPLSVVVVSPGFHILQFVIEAARGKRLVVCRRGLYERLLGA